MVRVALAATLATLVAGCFDDRYRCATDADCDLGAAPRCDDGFCTAHDPTCETERRYSEHSGELANACFAGQVALANPCAGGQPAATREGCAATVCDVLPACCDVGWSDACAQQAQLVCDGRCDTRIAVTAQRGAVTEHWELAFDPATAKWTAKQRTDRGGLLAWIGPAPGTVEPRLAGFNPQLTALLVGERSLPASPQRTYQSITSVDFDRSGRDTLAIGYAETKQFVELVDVDTGAVRDLFTDVGLRLAWGDSDRDGFPDGIAGRGATYTLLRNVDGDGHVRAIEATQSSAFGGGITPLNAGNTPQLRDLAWIDLTGDGRLDLVAFGNQIRVHADEGTLRDMPLIALDCDPLATNGSMACNDNTETTPTAWSGAVVPSASGPALVVAEFTDPVRDLPRKLFRVTIDPTRPAFTATPISDDCPTCGQIVAVIARDLDGDHVLDVIALDADLRIYTALGTGKLTTDPFPGSTKGPFVTVFTSVTGAPSP